MAPVHGVGARQSVEEVVDRAMDNISIATMPIMVDAIVRTSIGTSLGVDSIIILIVGPTSSLDVIASATMVLLIVVPISAGSFLPLFHTDKGPYCDNQHRESQAETHPKSNLVALLLQARFFVRIGVGGVIVGGLARKILGVDWLLLVAFVLVHIGRARLRISRSGSGICGVLQ